MGVKNFFGRLNSLFEGQETTVVFLDVGCRYFKGIVKEQGKFTSFFMEENKSEPAKEILALLRKHHLTTARLNIALKGPDTITRCISFPKVDKTSLRQAFGYELQKHIPFPPAGVYYDVCMLEENYSKTDALVLLAAAKKEAVDSIVEELARDNINVDEVSLASVCLMNLFVAALAGDANGALLDMGYGSTTLTVTRKNIPYLSREIKISGKTLIKKTASVKNCPATEVENMIVKGTGHAEILEIGEEILLGICEEVRSSFDYFEMNVGEQINALHLTGGLSALSGIDKIMAASLGVEVKPWRPWEKLGLTLPVDIPARPEIFTSVMGFAL